MAIDVNVGSALIDESERGAASEEQGDVRRNRGTAGEKKWRENLRENKADCAQYGCEKTASSLGCGGSVDGRGKGESQCTRREATLLLNLSIRCEEALVLAGRANLLQRLEVGWFIEASVVGSCPGDGSSEVSTVSSSKSCSLMLRSITSSRWWVPGEKTLWSLSDDRHEALCSDWSPSPAGCDSERDRARAIDLEEAGGLGGRERLNWEPWCEFAIGKLCDKLIFEPVLFLSSFPSASLSTSEC